MVAGILAHPVVLGIIGIVAAFLVVGSFVPLPNEYNVTVTVNSIYVGLIFTTYFQITGVQPQTTGGSPLLDWGATGLSFAPPSLTAQFSMTVCVGPGHCSTKSSSAWFPTVPIVSGQSFSSSNTFVVGYVPGGPAIVTVSLYDNNALVATGSQPCAVAQGC